MENVIDAALQIIGQNNVELIPYRNCNVKGHHAVVCQSPARVNVAQGQNNQQNFTGLLPNLGYLSKSHNSVSSISKVQA